MDEFVCAYLAGCIDSDGFITMQRCNPSPTRKDGRKKTYFVAKIGLSQTSPIIPDLLEHIFGGWRGEHQPKNPNHKKWHIWQATNSNALRVLPFLIPFLRLKRQQAELLLKFNAYDIDSRVELYNAITLLNNPKNRRVHRVISYPQK